MFRHHSQRPDPAVVTAHAEVEAMLGRLGHDVSTLDDGGDPTNRQALADAAERFNTAGAQLGEATSTGDLAVVRGVVIEGLHSTRLVRTRLGLDPGPEPAAVPVAAPPQPMQQQPAQQQPAWGGRRAGGGMGGSLGAGMAGGLLGMLGGEMLGGLFQGGDNDGGGWGGDGGGWGGGDDGGGW